MFRDDKKAKIEPKVEPSVNTEEAVNLPVEPKKVEKKTVSTDSHHDVDIKSAQIVLYKVSSEWLDNLLSKVKCEVMSKAIKHKCPSEFLDCLNSLELQLNDKVQFSLNILEPEEEPPASTAKK